MHATEIESAHINRILDHVYDWSRNQKYRGYNKHDGLNSPILNTLLGWGKWPRLIAIQGVMRFPVNIRPLLLTPKTYNPKGLALFTLGLLDRYRASNNHEYLVEAQQLLTLLLENRSPGNWAGTCCYSARPVSAASIRSTVHRRVTANNSSTCSNGSANWEK